MDCYLIGARVDMKRKRTQPISLADVLGGASRRIGFGNKLKHMKLMARWEKITGKSIAAHARPARLRGKTLIVRVDQPTWMQELTYLKHEIMERGSCHPGHPQNQKPNSQKLVNSMMMRKSS